jgi:AcrR family transcriptional regulator
VTDANPTPDNEKPAPDRHVRRRERTEKAILEAAEELIAEGGVDGLTIEGVAARSGVAKTTIYRRWRDKDELALAVLVERTATLSPPPDVGDTRKELLTFLKTAKQVIRPAASRRDSPRPSRPSLILLAPTASGSSMCAARS